MGSVQLGHFYAVAPTRAARENGADGWYVANDLNLHESLPLGSTEDVPDFSLKHELEVAFQVSVAGKYSACSGDLESRLSQSISIELEKGRLFKTTKSHTDYINAGNDEPTYDQAVHLIDAYSDHFADPVDGLDRLLIATTVRTADVASVTALDLGTIAFDVQCPGESVTFSVKRSCKETERIEGSKDVVFAASFVECDYRWHQREGEGNGGTVGDGKWACGTADIVQDPARPIRFQ